MPLIVIGTSSSQATKSFIPLYTMASNSHTFTTAGVTGRVGPTQAEMRAAYDTSANGNWDETYISQGSFQGYQDWTVPVTGTYSFDVRGASGYNGSGAGGVGRGVRIEGRLPLNKGDIITIAVGQVGAAPSSGGIWGGSGGGTFVVRKTNNDPLFVAGGGTAESNANTGRDGVLTTAGGRSSGNALGGSGGFGGLATGGYSGGGGGLLSRGGNGTNGQSGGGSFFDGLTMGTNARAGGYGGFGGGGQSDATTSGQAGGAGGYSGGAGSRNVTGSSTGGGGGSFIYSTATNVATSTGLWEASGTFNGNAITNLSAYHTGEGQVTVTLI